MASNRSEESTQSKQRITTIVLAILAIIFLILRLVARHMKRIGLGMDDWTLIVGLVGFLLI
jgi:nicotinamide riboside transporter PnuC